MLYCQIVPPGACWNYQVHSLSLEADVTKFVPAKLSMRYVPNTALPVTFLPSEDTYHDLRLTEEPAEQQGNLGLPPPPGYSIHRPYLLGVIGLVFLNRELYLVLYPSGGGDLQKPIVETYPRCKSVRRNYDAHFRHGTYS